MSEKMTNTYTKKMTNSYTNPRIRKYRGHEIQRKEDWNVDVNRSVSLEVLKNNAWTCLHNIHFTLCVISN